MNEGPLFGVCPIGKFVFSHEDALVQKALIEKSLRSWRIEFAGIDSAVKDGMVRGLDDVEPAVKCLRAAGVDGLFIPHCNFGTEHAAALIARDLGVPVLLWGPRDEAPLADGSRLRDTLCGMLATSKVLVKMGVPFTYIENCRITDAPFKDGVHSFLRAANVARAFRKGIRIGQIGQRIDFFWSTIIDEAELLTRFKVEVVPMDLAAVIRRAKERSKRQRSAYLDELKDLQRTIRIEGAVGEELANVLAVRDEILDLAREARVDALAVQDFMALVEECGAWCFLATSMITESYPYGIESDIHGAISTLILRRASLAGDPAFLVDMTVRHPENDNAVLIWHVGAPLSMRHPDSDASLAGHWILKGPYGGMPHFRLKDGPITVARFDGERGNYKLAFGGGAAIDGPYNQNNYVWMEVDDWPRWERTLIEGPFPHHMGMIYGSYAPALNEACKYIPCLRPVEL